MSIHHNSKAEKNKTL